MYGIVPAMGGTFGGSSSEPEEIEDTGPDLDAIISSSLHDAGFEGHAPAETATTDTIPDAGSQGQTRDPASGRFSSTATPSASAEPAAAVANPASTTDQPPVAASATLEAPARWSDADKASFRTMPPDAQRMLLDRHTAMEGEFTRKSQEIAAFRQSAEPVLSAIQPHAEYLQQLGLRPDQAVGQLLMAERSLRLGSPEQKVAALAGLAGQYGIDVRALVAGNRPDPVVSQLHQQGQQVDQRLRAMEARAQQEEQARAQLEHQGAVASVQAFAAEQNADGTPKHPHFEAVRGSMQQLIASGQATTLQDAYAKAAAPIMAAVEAERAKVQASQDAARQAQVGRARRVAPVVSSPGTNPGRAAPQGLDAIVQNALRDAGLPTLG